MKKQNTQITKTNGQISALSFKDYFKQEREHFEQHLEISFPKLSEKISLLETSMKYSLLAGGKRLRPILLSTTMRSIGVNPEPALAFAAALEYIHTYSLIHDDLPCMDDDDLRRGLPTNHVKFGEDVALLAGDGLLTHAFSLISNPELTKFFPAEAILKCVKLLSEKAGLSGMIAGQFADVKRDNNFEEADLLKYIHHNKTGALITLSIEMGAVLAGVKDEELERFSKFGEYTGTSFQIQDDILDEIGTTEELGKPVGSDLENDKLTYPKIYGIDKSKETAEKYYQLAIEELAALPYETKRLEELAMFIIKRSN